MASSSDSKCGGLTPAARRGRLAGRGWPQAVIRGGNRPPFPNRHVLLEPIHEFREQRDGLAAMRRRNADVNGRFTDRNDADAMNHLHCEARMSRGNFLKQPPDFTSGHFGIGFVFECADFLAVFLTAHDAAKFQPRAGRCRRPRLRRRNTFRDRLVRELDFDFHAQMFQPPDTGGIRATSSSSAKIASGAAYSQFRASRTFERWAASCGKFLQ